MNGIFPSVLLRANHARKITQDTLKRNNMKVRFASLLFSTIFTICNLIAVQAVVAAPQSFAPIVKSEKDKVVHISISSIIERPSIPDSKFRDPFFDKFYRNIPKKRRQSALGSGFIVSNDGYIVTNHHVIAKADKIEVTLYSGKQYKAKIVGKDKMSELALIKIEANNLPVIKWGDSSKIEVGDWMLAIGNPLGFDHTVTAGILSGRGRAVFGATAYGQFLQTDAAINFGNSGGPLFNMKGEVIGINTAIAAGGQNLGFAIPSNLAKKIIKQLKEFGKVKRGWFGVEIQDVDNELAESFGLPKGTKGVAITNVGIGSPAEKGGLVKGDIIIEFNDKPLSKATQLQQFVGETLPGSTVNVKIFRKGRFLEKKVTVGLRQSDEIVSLDDTVNKYGMRLVVMDDETRSSLGLKEDYGLLVYAADESGLAWEKGLRKGDVLLEANNKKLRNLDDFNEVLEQARKTAKPINLLIIRNGRTIFRALPVND
jgi:serine protease Do